MVEQVHPAEHDPSTGLRSPRSPRFASSARPRWEARRAVAIIAAFVALVVMELFELADDFAQAPVRGLVHVAVIAGAAASIDLVARRHPRGCRVSLAVGGAGLVLLALEHLAGVLAVEGPRDHWGHPLVIASVVANVAVLVAATSMSRRRSTR